MNFDESKTKENLARAFAAECQAGARYQFMATQAQSEQLPFLKDTLKMLAKNEMAHAKLFYDYIVDNSKSDKKQEICADYAYVESALEQSLSEEAKIEEEEFEKIYPSFAKDALDEGFEDISNSFLIVAGVERTHSGILKFLSKNYKSKTLYSHKQKVLMKCSNCGHIAFENDGWKECPLCSLGDGYIEISFAEILQDALKK